jgi:hypothetical protein
MELIYFHLRLCFPSGLFPLGFHTQTLYTFIESPVHSTRSLHHILLDFIKPEDMWWRVIITTFLRFQTCFKWNRKVFMIDLAGQNTESGGAGLPGCSYSRWRSGQSLPATPACYLCMKPDLQSPRGGQPGTYTHVATTKATNFERRDTDVWGREPR